MSSATISHRLYGAACGGISTQLLDSFARGKIFLLNMAYFEMFPGTYDSDARPGIGDRCRVSNERSYTDIELGSFEASPEARVSLQSTISHARFISTINKV